MNAAHIAVKQLWSSMVANPEEPPLIFATTESRGVLRITWQ